MGNRNAYKTALLFLGIIFLGIVVRSFVQGDDLFVTSSAIEQAANVGCSGTGC